jgi:hypothetical protein
MCDEREFLQRSSPDVLLLLDESSDIHYGRNNKNNVSFFSIMNGEIT